MTRMKLTVAVAVTTCFLLLAVEANAGAISSVQNGKLVDSTTWGGPIPTVGDTAILNHTVQMDYERTITQGDETWDADVVQINSGGKLDGRGGLITVNDLIFNGGTMTSTQNGGTHNADSVTINDVAGNLYTNNKNIRDTTLKTATLSGSGTLNLIPSGNKTMTFNVTAAGGTSGFTGLLDSKSKNHNNHRSLNVEEYHSGLKFTHSIAEANASFGIALRELVYNWSGGPATNDGHHYSALNIKDGVGDGSVLWFTSLQLGNYVVPGRATPYTYTELIGLNAANADYLLSDGTDAVVGVTPLLVSGFLFDGETNQTWGIDATAPLGTNWSGNVLPGPTDDPIIYQSGSQTVTLNVSDLSPTVASLQVASSGTNTQTLQIGGSNNNIYNTLTVSGDLILGDADSTGAGRVNVGREAHLIVEGDIVSANDADHTIYLSYVENKFTLHGDIGTAASTNTIDLKIVRAATLNLFAGTNQSINVDDFSFNVNVDGSLGGGRTITVGNGDSFVSTGDALIGKNTKPQLYGNRTTSAFLVVEDGGTAEFNTLTLGAVRGNNGGTGVLKGIGGITVDGTFTVNGLLTMATTDDYTPATAESRLTVNAGAVVTLDGGVTTCTGENDYTRSATITINGGDVTLGDDLTLGVGTNTTNTITLAGGKTDFGGNSVVLNPDGSGGAGSQTFDWSGGTLADVGTFGTSLTQGDDTGNTATLQIGADDTVGTMAISGDCNLLSDGIVEIDINGEAPGVDGGHDQLLVDGTADLNGMLQIDTGGYTPSLDSYFDVLILEDSADTITLGSAFSLGTANAPLLPAQFWYVDPDFLEQGILRLQIGVPEPSTFLLAALGFVGLAWFGRRRRR